LNASPSAEKSPESEREAPILTVLPLPLTHAPLAALVRVGPALEAVVHAPATTAKATATAAQNQRAEPSLNRMSVPLSRGSAACLLRSRICQTI
jgi:hypothetical protein